MVSPAGLSSAPENILLIKLRHHGDMLLTTPVINALRQRYPTACIDILLYKETLPMLVAHPDIHQIHVIDRAWKKESGWKKLCHELALVRTIRQRHYNIIVNLADQWRSALVTWLSAAPVRIGFSWPKRDTFFWRLAHNVQVPTHNHHQLHTVEQNMTALAPLGISADGAKVSMHYDKADKQKVLLLLAQQHIDTNWVVVHPAARWRFKCWEDEKVAALIDGLTQLGKKVILTAAPDKNELNMIDHILSLCQTSEVISLAGQLSLPQLAALIDRAQLFIGVDSAPTHIAAALNTPCLALFGPSKITCWRPWGEKNQLIWAGDYGPLPDPDTIDTQTTRRYLSAIPVEAVLAAARSAFNG